MNDCITTTKQSTTKLCAYFLGYTVAMAEMLEKLDTQLHDLFLATHHLLFTNTVLSVNDIFLYIEYTTRAVYIHSIVQI